MLCCCRLPRAEITFVVEVDAISDDLKVAGRSKLVHHREQLVFAMKATPRIIADVFSALEFLGVNDFDRDALLACECDRVLELKTRKTWRIRDHRQHVTPERLMTGPGQKRGITSPGVRNERAAQRAEMLVEDGALGG